MPRDYHDRKLTRRHRFRNASHLKLMDIIKSLRHRRLRRSVSHRSSSTHSRTSGFPLLVADPVQPLSLDISTSPSLRLSCYRSDAASILSITEEDCSSGMSASSPSLDGTSSGVDRGHLLSLHSVPNFPTSPSVFQLRSSSPGDYLVERLEQKLRRLHLGDVASPNHVSSSSPLRVIPMDVSPQPFCRPPSAVKAQKPASSPRDQNVVPTIHITSADAKHAKPLPLSDHRPSGRTPFGSSNYINQLTNVSSTKSKLNTLTLDDPFTTLPGPHGAAYPFPDHLTFHLPSFPLASSSLYAPETPTPMYCDHPGDCSGGLWEIWHPPLVASRFTLPPFALPPLDEGIFDDTAT